MKVIRCREGAKLPTKATGDMCYDIYACIDGPIELWHGKPVSITTGVKIALPSKKHASIRPRSGLAAKHGVDVLAGQIDNSYRGEWVVVLTTHKQQSLLQRLLRRFGLGRPELVINNGDKIAQVKLEADITSVVVEVFSEEELGTTDRGDKGFGSSGR